MDLIKRNGHQVKGYPRSRDEVHLVSEFGFVGGDMFEEGEVYVDALEMLNDDNDENW